MRAADSWLSVPSSAYSCFSSGSLFVTALYSPPDEAMISTFGATSSDGDVFVSMVKSWTFNTIEMNLYCIGLAGNSSVITAWVRDDLGRVSSTSFPVNIN